MKNKLDSAYARGVLTERGRLLWLMEDERAFLRKQLEGVILVESQRHAMQVKIKMAITIFEQLKMRLMAGDAPPTKETENGETEITLDEGEGS